MVMDTQLTTELFVALIGLITSLGTLAAAYAAYLKSKSNSEKLDENTTITKKVDVATNGRMDALIAQVSAIHAATVANNIAKEVVKETNQQAANPPKEAI